MGRRHWQGKRRVREEGPEGSGCWECIRSAEKRRVMVQRQVRRLDQRLRTLRAQVSEAISLAGRFCASLAVVILILRSHP